MKRTTPKMSANEDTTVASRSMLSNLLGLSFNGQRDIYEAFGWKRNLSFEDYDYAYKRNPIAKAVISRPARDTWSGDMVIVETNDDKQTEFEKQFDQLQKRLGLKSKFARLDRISSIGQYGVMLLGFSDCRTREDFSKPVTAKSNLDLLYVKPVKQIHATIHRYDKKPNSERYGLPELYSVGIKGISGQGSSETLVVHHSRILHVAWDLMEDENEGTPVLEAIFNNIQDLDKLSGGSAEMFWRGARPGFQGNVDKDFSISPDDEKRFKEQMDEYAHNLRRFLVMQGIEIKDLSPQVEDPTNHVKTQIGMISAITGIPQRVLLGAEQGELASGQDANAWKILIQNRRTEQAEQIIVRPFVDRLIEFGVLPRPQTEDYSIMWSDLFAPSEKERAETGKTRAAAVQQYLQNPIAVEIIPPKVFLKYFLGLDKQQLEFVEELSVDELNDEEQFRRLMERLQPAAPKEPQQEEPQNEE